MALCPSPGSPCSSLRMKRAVCPGEAMHTEAESPELAICLTWGINSNTRWSRKVHTIAMCDWGMLYGKEVTYCNKHNTQGQGISHHQLHNNKTHTVNITGAIHPLQFPVPNPATHTHAETIISIAFTHPHIQCKQPPLIHTSNHTCKHTPPHTLMPWPPTAGWARPQFGWSPEFLTLGCECYLFYECCVVWGAWWEVGAVSAWSLSRTMILRRQKQADSVVISALRFLHIMDLQILYINAHTCNVHTNSIFCPPCPLL